VTAAPGPGERGWVKVVSDVLGRIERGELEHGGKVPSRGVLAGQSGVSLYAVSRALSHLAARGVIRMDRGHRNGYVAGSGAPDVLAAADSPPLLAAGLRRLRIEHGLNQVEAAELLGVHSSAVCRIEQGARSPFPARVIASAFGVPVAEVTAPCPRCRYRPDPGYMCLRCGTAAAAGRGAPEKLAAAL
jgi:DNA-binding transcriptional MocR family regulator